MIEVSTGASSQSGDGVAAEQLGAVLGGVGHAAAARSAASTSAATWSGEAAVPLTEALPAPWKATTVTSTLCITPLVVRVLLAQRRLAPVVSWTIATHCSEREESRACSTSCCGRAGCRHAPPSSVVFSTRMPRNSAAGQPWLTGADCPGWALPQFIAPPSSQVCGPPTASMAPQKSVVVAW